MVDYSPTQQAAAAWLCPLPSLPTAVDVVRGEVVCGGREYGRWQFGRARPIVIPAPPRLATVAALPIAYRRPRWWAVLLRGCGCVCAWVRVCLGPAAVGATPTPRLCVREAVRRCCGAASH